MQPSPYPALNALLLAYLLAGENPIPAEFGFAAPAAEQVPIIIDYMQKAGYPLAQFEAHLAEHIFLLQAFVYICAYAEQPHAREDEEFLARLSKGMPPTLVQALNHVVNWLMND